MSTIADVMDGIDMTQDQITLLAIKGAIASLPPDEEAKCYAMIEEIRKLYASFGPVAGGFAIALLGAELQMED